jgi:hypothetical protein
MTHASCSAATATMTLNAALAQSPKKADDKVITESDLLDKIKTEHWKERVTSATGYHGRYGANLEELGRMVKQMFIAYGFPNA